MAIQHFFKETVEHFYFRNSYWPLLGVTRNTWYKMLATWWTLDMNRRIMRIRVKQAGQWHDDHASDSALTLLVQRRKVNQNKSFLPLWLTALLLPINAKTWLLLSISSALPKDSDGPVALADAAQCCLYGCPQTRKNTEESSCKPSAYSANVEQKTAALPSKTTG